MIFFLIMNELVDSFKNYFSEKTWFNRRNLEPTWFWFCFLNWENLADSLYSWCRSLQDQQKIYNLRNELHVVLHLLTKYF